MKEYEKFGLCALCVILIVTCGFLSGTIYEMKYIHYTEFKIHTGYKNAGIEQRGEGFDNYCDSFKYVDGDLIQYFGKSTGTAHNILQWTDTLTITPVTR